MPYWVHNRWRDPEVRDVIEQLWTELPEDAIPNEIAGQPHWTRLDNGQVPRRHTEREPLIRVFVGMPGESQDETPPTTQRTPPRGWVWYTDGIFTMPGDARGTRQRRYWVRIDGEERPESIGYPSYRNRHGWIRWRHNTWAPNDCRQHPAPTPGVWECGHCGNPQEVGTQRLDVTVNSVMMPLCPVCRREVVFNCNVCAQPHYYRNLHRGLTYRVGPGQYDTRRQDVCLTCYARPGPDGRASNNECSCCGYICDVGEGAGTRTRNGVICQFCIISNASCPHCHMIVRRNTMRRNGTRCDYCQDRTIRGHGDRTANGLGPFGASRVKMKHGRSVDMTIRYGVELEVEVGSDEQSGSPRYSVEEKAQEVLDKLGEDYAITKHDGSLINGFEIVTAPAPLEEHYKRFEKFRSKTKGLTCESGRAGMHVHASRAPLTQLQIGKLLVFINDPNNRPHIKKIASRDSNGFCKSSVKKIRDVRHDAGDRYQSINLQNRNTIEYRIFKATTNVDSILKNIEFVAATIEWAGNTSMRQLGWQDFADYVGKTPGYYPHLAEWLRNHGYLKKPKAPKPPALEPKPKE